jgi:hypothetical protein
MMREWTKSADDQVGGALRPFLMPKHDEILGKRDKWPTGSVRIARFRKWCAMHTLLSQTLRLGNEALAAPMEEYPSEKI